MCIIVLFAGMAIGASAALAGMFQAGMVNKREKRIKEDIG